MIKIALSFDDGRKDNYRLIKDVLLPMKLPATFNITTDYVSEVEDPDRPCQNLPMSKAELTEIFQYPLFEIAGHGKQHHNDFHNLIEGIQVLKDWGKRKEFGIASPNSKLEYKALLGTANRYKAEHIKYIRTGDRLGAGYGIKRIVRKINTYIHSPFLMEWIYKNTFLTEQDDFILTSIPILKTTSLKEVKGLIEKAIHLNQSLILMFHSVLKEDEAYYTDRWTWDYDDFVELCHDLLAKQEQHKLVVSRTIELIH